MRKFFLPAFLLLILLSRGEVRALEADVEDLSDRSYFPRAVQLIDQAHQSIFISLYEFDADPARARHPGTQLFGALLRAKARKVSIYILLNRNYEFLKAGEASLFDRNDAVYAALKEAGIQEVYFADPGRRVHDKLVVIDGEWVIEGSHNWSSSALKLNRESATLVHSAAYARLKQERIKGLKKAQTQEEDLEKKFPLENAFLKDPRYLKRFVGAGDFRSMALYLWLRYEADRRGENSFELELEKMAGWARLSADWSRSAVRRQLIRVLRKKLMGRYGLIEVEIGFGEKARIRLLPIESEERGFSSLPVRFFEYGTIRSLSEAGLAVYLTALYLSETSPIRPWWSVPQNAWAALFGISPDVIQTGSEELRRANLLEVIFFGFDQKPFFKDRPPNQYRLNQPVSQTEETARWQRLREQAGDHRFLLARRYARDLGDPRDPELTGKLIELFEKYPQAWIERAMRRMEKLKADNPRKNIYYIEGILTGWSMERD